MKAISGQMETMESGKLMNPAKTRRIVVVAGMVVVGVGWYLFRPELLFVNKTVNESLPAASAEMAMKDTLHEPMTLARGTFHKGAHETKGTATIHRFPDGKRVLRLANFETSNGPDVRVYLVAADDAMDSETVKAAGHIELGKLKGNMGDQNYDVPDEVDLAKYRAVTIWCARFGVNFGTAPLM